MNFNLDEALDMLSRTPRTLESLLSGLSKDWLHSREGEGTWNPVEVIEHLIEAEKFNWIPRLNVILADGENTLFPAFDRYAHLNQTERQIEQALAELHHVRMENVAYIQRMTHSSLDLEKKGVHPAFGVVQVSELLSAWVVHDFTHISQIVRVMAERYRTDVGPWSAYLGILNRK
ncbi:DinB family protein [Bacillus altitudinis]|uniref:DinB family protein n=1 Tax=Bacillus altitudinis TaxID=293387 RepID=UPI003CF798C8